MRIGHLYSIETLQEKIPGFRLIEITNHQYDEDNGDYRTEEFRLTNQSNIERLHTSYGFGRWESVEYIDEDGNKHKVHNVKFSGEPVDTIKVRDILSPRLKIHDRKYIEKTSEFVTWLEYIKADIEELDKDAIEIKHYDQIEYAGISDVSICKHGGYFSYSSENLVLDEREIESVLNGIDDILLRKKIESILYARVFKRRK